MPKPPCYGNPGVVPECLICSSRVRCVQKFNDKSGMKFNLLPNPLPAEPEPIDLVVPDTGDTISESHLQELEELFETWGLRKGSRGWRGKRKGRTLTIVRADQRAVAVHVTVRRKQRKPLLLRISASNAKRLLTKLSSDPLVRLNPYR